MIGWHFFLLLAVCILLFGWLWGLGAAIVILLVYEDIKAGVK